MSSKAPSPRRAVELPVRGMDCAECSQHVQQALTRLPGVEGAQVSPAVTPLRETPANV